MHELPRRSGVLGWRRGVHGLRGGVLHCDCGDFAVRCLPRGEVRCCCGFDFLRHLCGGQLLDCGVGELHKLSNWVLLGVGGLFFLHSLRGGAVLFISRFHCLHQLPCRILHRSDHCLELYCLSGWPIRSNNWTRCLRSMSYQHLF